MLLCILSGICNAQQLLDVPEFRKSETDTIYGDVLSHSINAPHGDQHGRPTNVHETVHGINSYIRNRLNSYGGIVNGFYYGKGYAVIIKEPNIKIKDIYIPLSLRSYKYDPYFNKQAAYWNDRPLYIIDEWICYVYGGQCALEDHRNQRTQVYSDYVSSCLDFSIYSALLYHTIKEKDASYDAGELKLFMDEFMKRAEKAFFEGRNVFESSKQEILLHNLRHSSDAQIVRDILVKDFKSAFLNDPQNNK
jgi:hypothetical protein